MAIAGSLTPTRALFACIVAAVVAALLPAPSQAADPASHDKVEKSVIRKVNAIRQAYRLPRLQANGALARSADFHCADMLNSNFFGHPSSNGDGMEHRVESFRRSSWVGETLAFVPSQASVGQAGRIVRMWMHSKPHRDSLLSRRFTRIGVARRGGMLGSSPTIVFTADLASAR